MSAVPSHELAWRVARHCDGGACVRVATSQGMVVVGDSKNPEGPLLYYTPAEWKAFLEAAKKDTSRHPG